MLHDLPVNSIDPALLDLAEPVDYFQGVGEEILPTPTNILMFIRTTRDKLQQNALQNRSHHRFVLAFNLKTKGQVQVNHLSHPFAPGQALLIHPFQFHHFCQLDSPKLQWLFCTFELEPVSFLESLRNRVVPLGNGTPELLEQLLHEWHANRRDRELQSGLLRLLLSLKRDLQSSGNALPNELPDNLLRKINRLLADWRGRPVLVDDLARSMNISSSRLRALFKQIAGVTLGSYLQNYRINRAMALLRTTSLTVNDVAEEAGFGSAQAFSRCFKKETGHTPRDYRGKG